MTRMVRQPFTPGGKFTAAKDFKFNGKKYTRGSEFPWRTICCSVRKLRQLYEGRFLNNQFVDEEELAAMLDETVTAPEPKDVEPEVDETDDEDDDGEDDGDDEDDEDGDEVNAYDPETHEIINPERGEWYLADAEGNRLLKLKAKEAKRLRKKHEMTDINPDGIFEE